MHDRGTENGLHLPTIRSLTKRRIPKNEWQSKSHLFHCKVLTCNALMDDEGK